MADSRQVSSGSCDGHKNCTREIGSTQLRGVEICSLQMNSSKVVANQALLTKIWAAQIGTIQCSTTQA